MFERLIMRIAAEGEARVRSSAQRIAAAAEELRRNGLGASAERDGVRISGKRLRTRLALETALRSFWRRLP